MGKPTALIIEDDRDVAELYSHVVESAGLATEIVATGEAALARLAVRVPAFVLLDLNLPSSVSGADVLHHIRADRRLVDTRVVVATGHPDLADAVRAEADLVLLKPIDVAQLSGFVARLRQKG
jgi:two-component system response regulator GlrR